MFIVLESAVEQSSADVFGGLDDEMLIMDTSEDFGGDFVGFE